MGREVVQQSEPIGVKSLELKKESYDQAGQKFPPAGSASVLSSGAMELVILDEMNKYPPPSGAEPNAFVMARARTNSFPHTYKIYGGSTPTDEEVLITQTIHSRADEIRYY